MASNTTIPIACALVILLAIYDAEAVVGINWGRQSAQRLLPSQVVDLLLQNGIGHARVYTSQSDILAAFAGSGINLTVTSYPGALSTKESANAWMDKNMDFFIASNIRWVYLGGYPFGKDADKAKRRKALDAIHMLQAALNERKLGHLVKVNLLHFELGLKPNLTKPSENEFLDDARDDMIEYLQFLRENDAHFPIEIFPLMTAIDRFDLSFAFPDNNSSVIIQDINGAVYTNVFEWQYDCFAWALAKLNASDIKIVVSQVGWPTDGYPGADVANAEYFFKNLLPLVTSNKGTPMRPGAPIDINIHALADETKNGAGPLSRHWGIYRSNGVPKYMMDFSGQGRDVYPKTIKGIMKMPHRWCLFNGDQRDKGKVEYWFEWACNKTDCSSLSPGGSCSSLSPMQNVSFAFNMYFQFEFQQESDCDFQGLAYLSVEDPSTESCVFPVEVVKGRQNNFLPPSHSSGCRRRTPNLGLFVVCFWILLFMSRLTSTSRPKIPTPLARRSRFLPAKPVCK